MDPHQPSRCKWEGCRSYDVIPGGIYCLEHKALHHQGRFLQPDRNQAFSSPTSNPLPGLSRNPAASRLGNRVVENGLPGNLFSSGMASPTNEKKQLPDKHTARKSVKQPSNIGQAHVASTASPMRKPSMDTLPGNQRPVKRPRPSGVPNMLGLYPRSDSSSLSENGIPHLASRGMFRQPEERTYKLSAVDDFALRPKKKEIANESAGPKPYNDQRQLHREDSRLNNTSRSFPSSTKPPQNTTFKGNPLSGSFVIDLTRDDELVPPSPRPKPQPSLGNHVPNGITADIQKPQRIFDGIPNLSCEPKDTTVSSKKQRCDGPPVSQPGGISQAHHGLFVEQARDLHNRKPVQDIIPSAAIMQPISNPSDDTISEAPISKQNQNTPVPSNGLGPVHTSPSDPFIHKHGLPARKQYQLTNGIGHSSPSEKSPAPTNPGLDASITEQTMAKTTTKTTVKSKPIADAPPVSQLQDTKVTPVQQSAIRQGPLSALLGGREWKKMTPEERRCFWVSQHDPKEFDAQIYSENNKPFRPGDPLFGVPDDELPPRPQRSATRFDYIDPRIHHSRQLSEEQYQKKQKEILARGNRKKGLGEAVKRAVQRKRGASKPNQKQKQDSLPQRVRENPKWLKALEVLEQIELQTRTQRETGNPQRKGKAKATTAVELDSDTEMESS